MTEEEKAQKRKADEKELEKLEKVQTWSELSDVLKGTEEHDKVVNSYKENFAKEFGDVKVEKSSMV